MARDRRSDPRSALDEKLAYGAYLVSSEAAQLQAWIETQPHDETVEDGLATRSASVRAAHTYWVATEMVRVAEVAEQTMPDEDVLLEEPPSPHGFLILAEPLAFAHPEEPDEQLRFGALHWRPAHRSLPPSRYAPAQEDDGVVLQWFTISADPAAIRHRGSDLSPLNGAIFLPAGLPLQMSGSVEIGALDTLEAELARCARAMWTLMQQPLAATKDLRPSDSQMRRAHKLTQSPPDPVVVVTLRRTTTNHTSATSPVEWSHRWIVRGHWRNQWHPRLKAHRPTWISEHVKGPDDVPLAVKDKVIAWKR